MPEQINELIHALRHGNEEAFDRLSSLYSSLVSSLVSKYSGELSPGDAELDDIHQEALIALYSAALTYDTDQREVSFGLYAKICIGNRVISAARKLRVRGEHSADLSDDVLELEDSSSDPSKRLDDKESVRLLAHKVSSLLSDYERSVFARYLRDMSVSEIARSLGKSPKSVDNALVRIKSKLRRLL